MSKDAKNSTAHERQLKGYLKPLLLSKLPEVLQVTGYTKSELVNEGVRAVMAKHNILPRKK